MPLFMDIHKDVKNITPEKIKEAHSQDLKVQGRHDAKFKNYWFNEKTGTVFCLSEAPNKEAARSVHRESHGMVPAEIIEVKEGK
jgi:hypothetical protein